MKVRNLENKNQFVIESGNKVTFQSYDSTIATIDRDAATITIYPDYNYSKTTGKHRNIFFDTEGFSGLATLKGLQAAMKEGHYNNYRMLFVNNCGEVIQYAS